MPNWVLNKVRIHGTVAQIARVKKSLKTCNRKEFIRLAKAKLSGKEQMEEWETMEMVERQLESYLASNDNSFTNWFDFKKVIPMPKHSDNFNARKDVSANDMDNPNNWYSWSIKNWGTKWNSYDAMLTIDTKTMLEYEFNTAWNAPFPVIEKLSMKYHVRAECDYYDGDDFPNRCGSYVCDHGNVVEDDVRNGDLNWIADTFGEDVLDSYGYKKGSFARR